MCVVLEPPTVSLPTIVGFRSQCSGWIPSFESTLVPPELETGDAICEKLDSSFLEGGRRELIALPLEGHVAAGAGREDRDRPELAPELRLTLKFDFGSLPFRALERTAEAERDRRLQRARAGRIDPQDDRELAAVDLVRPAERLL